MTERNKSLRGFKPFSSVLEDFFTLGEKGECDQLGTGLMDLDSSTAGMLAGHLVVVGGRPEVGKTSFALSIAEHVGIRQGRPVGIFSIESTNRIVASRILAAECLVPVNNVLSGRLSSSQFQVVKEAAGKLERAPIFMDSVQQLDIERLVREATRAREDGKLDLLIIDHVQLLRDFSRDYENKDEEFSAIVRSLKHLARNLEIPVIAVSQISSQRRLRAPRLEDLEGAGPLTDHADLILLIHRPELISGEFDECRGIAEIIIAKNRLGDVGTYRAAFLESVPAFRNLSLR